LFVTVTIFSIEHYVSASNRKLKTGVGMEEKKSQFKGFLVILGLLFSTVAQAHPINDYFKKHKNDTDVEARIVPPKMAALMIDKEDYPEAIDVLQSMTALKYMDYWGEEDKVKRYAQNAIRAKGNYDLLLEEQTDYRNIAVYGIKKKGTVRRLMAVVKTKSRFLLIIGKGKLTDKQMEGLPALSKEL